MTAVEIDSVTDFMITFNIHWILPSIFDRTSRLNWIRLNWSRKYYIYVDHNLSAHLLCHTQKRISHRLMMMIIIINSFVIIVTEQPTSFWLYIHIFLVNVFSLTEYTANSFAQVFCSLLQSFCYCCGFVITVRYIIKVYLLYNLRYNIYLLSNHMTYFLSTLTYLNFVWIYTWYNMFVIFVWSFVY